MFGEWASKPELNVIQGRQIPDSRFKSQESSSRFKVPDSKVPDSDSRFKIQDSEIPRFRDSEIPEANCFLDNQDSTSTKSKLSNLFSRALESWNLESGILRV